jgi:hypothetical protein
VLGGLGLLDGLGSILPKMFRPKFKDKS